MVGRETRGVSGGGGGGMETGGGWGEMRGARGERMCLYVCERENDISF